MMLVASSPVVFLSFVLVLSTSAAGRAGQESVEPSSLQSGAPQTPRSAAGLIEFYRSVHALTQSPPVQREFVRSCEKKIGEQFVTILGVAHAGRPFIIALTKKRLAKPSQDISLTKIYAEFPGEIPKPVAYDPRSATATLDWAYVFDRNGDGRIDYFAYLESAMPVRPVDHEGELPSLRGRIGKETYLMAFIRNSCMVFWHMADWNCDGREDAAMAPLRDDGNGWIDSWLLAMDADFDGEYEWCSVLDQALGGEPHPCEKGDRGYRAPGKALLGIPQVPPRVSMLDLMNKGVAECGLKGSAFYRGPAELLRELAAEP